jgi:hypothetical protein
VLLCGVGIQFRAVSAQIKQQIRHTASTLARLLVSDAVDGNDCYSFLIGHGFEESRTLWPGFRSEQRITEVSIFETTIFETTTE